jgi:hypothetical protein
MSECDTNRATKPTMDNAGLAIVVSQAQVGQTLTVEFFGDPPVVSEVSIKALKRIDLSNGGKIYRSSAGWRFSMGDGIKRIRRIDIDT